MSNIKNRDVEENNQGEEDFHWDLKTNEPQPNNPGLEEITLNLVLDKECKLKSQLLQARKLSTQSPNGF